MKKLFEINDTMANQISYYHLVVLLATLPFDRFYSHLVLASFAIHTLIQLKKNNIKPVFNLRTLALQSVFFVTVAGTIYTITPSGAYQDWVKQLPILLLPILFCLNPLDIKKYRANLLMAFSLVCTLTIIYLYWDALATIRHYKLPLSILLSSTFTNHNFSEPIDMHATFFSMQVAVALVYLLSVLIKERLFRNKLLCCACCFILLAGLVQLCSKSVFVALLISLNIIAPWFMLEGKKRLRFVLISLALSGMVITGILNLDAFKERYVVELKEDLSRSTITETTDPRLARWGVAMELVGKSPIIGYGTGSEIGLLHEQFFQKKLYSSYLNNLNAHNQYLSFLLQSGVLGLLVYLAGLSYGFKIAFRKKDLHFFTFLALMAVVSVSENMLDVDKGIFFYAFFFSFFVFGHEEKKTRQIPENTANYLVSVATDRELVTS